MFQLCLDVNSFFSHYTLSISIKLQPLSVNASAAQSSEFSHCFDLLPAGHRVPHARPAKWIHVLHNDERSLLQCHDGQVVVLPARCPPIQLIARPHVVFHGKGTVLPFANLRMTHSKQIRIGSTYLSQTEIVLFQQLKRKKEKYKKCAQVLYNRY